MNKIIKEACVTSLADAILAEQNGANQLELCSRLDLDGITPSERLVKTVVTKVSIPVKVLIRPRGGNFVYNNEELLAIEKQIKYCNQLNISGIVIGALNSDNKLNISQLKRLVKVADALPVYIHKAIDVTQNPLQSIKLLRKELPTIAGVLTSGGATTAEQGLPILKKMMEYDTRDFQIVVAGKVVPENIESLHQVLNARYYHGRNIVSTQKNK